MTVYDLTGLRFPETHTRRSTALHTAMLSHAAQRADAIIVMSQSCRNDLVELLGADPDVLDDDEDDDVEEEAILLPGRQTSAASDFKNFTSA